MKVLIGISDPRKTWSRRTPGKPSTRDMEALKFCLTALHDGGPEPFEGLASGGWAVLARVVEIQDSMTPPEALQDDPYFQRVQTLIADIPVGTEVRARYRLAADACGAGADQWDLLIVGPH